MVFECKIVPVSNREDFGRFWKILGREGMRGSDSDESNKSGRARLLYAQAVIERMMCSGPAGQSDWLENLVSVWDWKQWANRKSCCAVLCNVHSRQPLQRFLSLGYPVKSRSQRCVQQLFVDELLASTQSGIACIEAAFAGPMRVPRGTGHFAVKLLDA